MLAYLAPFSANVFSQGLDWHPLRSLSALKFSVFPKVLSLLYLKSGHQILSFSLSFQYFKNITTAFPTEKTTDAAQGKEPIVMFKGAHAEAWGQIQAVQTEVEYYSIFVLAAFSSPFSRAISSWELKG